MTFETQKERLAAWQKLKPLVIEYNKINLKKAEKLKKIQQLQNELNKLS